MTETADGALQQRKPTQVARNPEPLAKTVRVWLYLYLATSMLVVVSTAVSLALATSLPPETPVSFSEPTPGLELGDFLVGVSSVLFTFVYLVAGFLTLKWIFRVSRNAHVLASGLTVRPPWAVGWYFVPFANLLMPFRALREAWQASENPQAWRSVPVPSLLRWWWGFWLVENTLGSMSFRLGLRADTLGETAATQMVEIVSGLSDIPLVLALVRIVTRLSAMQQASLQRETFA
jgi:hypothetical protein